MAHSRLHPYPRPLDYATGFRRGVVTPTWPPATQLQPRPRRNTKLFGSDATWALTTASKVERIFKVSPADASEFVQSLAERLPTSTQLDRPLTSSAIVASVKQAVASEFAGVRSEMQLFRKEVASETAGMLSDMQLFRKEVAAEVTGVRSEVQLLRQEVASHSAVRGSEVQLYRQEVASQTAVVRSEMQLFHYEVRSELQQHRLEMRLMFAVMVISLLVLLGFSPAGVGVVGALIAACLMLVIGR